MRLITEQKPIRIGNPNDNHADVSVYNPDHLRKQARWIRDCLDPQVASNGPDALHSDDILKLDEFLRRLLVSNVSLEDLRYSRIHSAIMEIAGRATRWPRRLIERCEALEKAWEKSYGPLGELTIPLYEPRGRLYGVCRPEELNRDKLVARCAISEHMATVDSKHSWWIHPIFAFHDGIIDNPNKNSGITFDAIAAYAILMTDEDEISGPDPQRFTYRTGEQARGRYKLTACTRDSRVPIRVLRSHTLKGFWHKVTGFSITKDKLTKAIMYDIHFAKIMPDEVTRDIDLESLLIRPWSDEIDDYKEYKRLRRLTHAAQTAAEYGAWKGTQVNGECTPGNAKSIGPFVECVTSSNGFQPFLPVAIRPPRPVIVAIIQMGIPSCPSVNHRLSSLWQFVSAVAVPQMWRSGASTPLVSISKNCTMATLAQMSPTISDDNDKSKQAADHLDEIQAVPTEMMPPPLVQLLSHVERVQMERALVRKIDWRLLPPVIIMYIMVPSNLFLNKIGKPALYLPAVMVVWGIISTATAAARSYTDLVVIRFFLGFVEAAYFPGCLFYLSTWYTRKELAFRSAILYSGSLMSGAFAGLIAAGITNGMDGLRGIPAWRWLFIVEGSVTVVIALVAFFILPNFPRTTMWLTEEERQLAVWRLQEDIGVDDWVSSGDQSFWHGMVLAFKDIKVWILMLLLLGIVSSASVTNFFPSVVQTLGYSNIISLLLTAPPYILAMITAFFNAWHADKTGERFLHITIPLVVGMVSFILAAATTSTAPRYLAMMLMVPGIYTGYVVVLAWISNTIPRPPAKRAAALAAINAVSNASSIYASYMYSGKPRYIVAFSVNCCTLLLAFVCTTVLRVMLTRLNRKLDRGEHVEGAVNGVRTGGGKGFRYLV
nr:putative transporter [Quercus suber]